MQGTSKSIEVGVDYAGKPAWKINQVTSSDSFITVVPTEVSRQNGRVRYNLVVSMSGGAPVGPLESELVVHTNDRNLTTVPLRLMANIAPEISVSPQTLSLGDIVQGAPIKQLIVLKGHQPFLIKSIESREFDIEAKLSEESKTLHALPMIITPKTVDFGKEVKGKITFSTDLREKPWIDVGTVFRLKSTIESTIEK